MDRPSRFRWFILAAAAFVVVAAVVVLFSVGALTPSHSSPGTPTPLVKTYLNLSISYDASTGIANYTTPFISIVAHTLVIVTITNWDPTASPLFVSWDNHVVGTVGGNETVNCGGAPETVSSLPQNDISHTWTVLDAYYNISVPIPPAPSASVPCAVTFEVTMGQSEMTSWGCVANCDNGLMAAGRMWGLLLVTA